MRPRAGSSVVRPGCGLPAPGCDRLAVRRFQFVPLLGLPGFPVYAMRRGDCPRCAKVKVERVWAGGKRRSTKAFARFLAGWAKCLSRQNAARSRPAPAAKVAGMLLNWFRTGKAHSSGAVEGLNGKAKLALRKAYGLQVLRRL